ncbi:Hypothetical protein D9617_1g085810 [Elsinoe fawcettii]|nr:Hypothetical protein D9617_1g085810 [Elsinoe fawcettii]
MALASQAPTLRNQRSHGPRLNNPFAISAQSIVPQSAFAPITTTYSCSMDSHNIQPVPHTYLKSYRSQLSLFQDRQEPNENPGLSTDYSPTASNHSQEMESVSPRTVSTYPSPTYQQAPIPWSTAAINAFHPVQLMAPSPVFQHAFFPPKIWDPTPAWPTRSDLPGGMAYDVWGREPFHDQQPGYLPSFHGHTSSEIVYHTPESEHDVDKDTQQEPDVGPSQLVSPPALHLQPCSTTQRPLSPIKTLEDLTVRADSEVDAVVDEAEPGRPARLRVDNSKLTATERKRRDTLLLKLKDEGKTYREIREIGGFEEHESTLRGRMRILRRPEHAKKRKPKWSVKDIRLLEDIVDEEIETAMREKRFKTRRGKDENNKYFRAPWSIVADKLHQRGAVYPFGPASCSKKWRELHPGGATF